MDTKTVESNERRRGTERRSGGDRRLVSIAAAVAGSIEEAAHKDEKTLPLAIEITGSVIAVILGLFVYKITGLYDATNSLLVRVGLGAVIAFWFILNIRQALHMK